MRQKLQIDRSVARWEDFQAARRSFVFWPQRKKLDVLEGLFLLEDTGISRSKYAAANGISRRTMERWINDFNAGGLMFALESALHRPGRKRKVGLQDFREHILPVAEDALHRSGIPTTIKNLYEAARNRGLVDASYATFRRRLQRITGDYKRRKIVPTIDELLYQNRTGRWPTRLKAYGRRREKRQKQAWQRMREDCQQESARWKAEAAAA